ncbi:hypothetical protein M8J77_000710 [Diaphorina citri]|nr:hypothetical protein M8J77_000710 [Diaphorina citri]
MLISGLSSISFVFFVCFVNLSHQFDDTKFLPTEMYSRMRTTEIIRYWGYPAEEHKVTTEDGYILTIFRIPNPGKTPVLFLHGLTASSDCWLTRDPSADFVFLLWKRGYDIWFWNARGNLYSRGHVNLTPKSDKFCRFAMNELGLYDTTATIDYILNQTGHNSLITLGHSLGTTNVLIAGSLRPEYQTKVRLNVLWAQSAFLGNLVTKDFLEGLYGIYARWTYKDNAIAMEKGTDVEVITRYLCYTKSPTLPLCKLLLELSSGFGSNQTVATAGAKMMTKFPGSSSVNLIKHVVQSVRTGQFKPLSYGRKENLKRYGAPKPPPYPIENFNTPTAIYFGCCNDFLSSGKDAYILRSRLKNVVKFYKVPYRLFNHGDFLWGVDSYRLLYKDTLDLIDAYNQESNNVDQPTKEDN